MAILAFKFILIAFLAYFLKIKDKQALLSLFLKILSSGINNKVIDSKVAYGKYIGSKKASNEKVSGSLIDFTLSLLLLSTKSYKKCFGIYFLKSY